MPICQFVISLHAYTHDGNNIIDWVALVFASRGRPWPNRYSCCTVNVYKLDAYAGARGFDPEFMRLGCQVPAD